MSDRESLPTLMFPMEQRLHELSIMKAFLEDEADLQELRDTLNWFITKKPVEIARQLDDWTRAVESTKEQESDLSTRRKRLEGKVEALKNLVRAIMEELEIQAVPAGGYGTIRISTASQPKLTILDMSKLPDEFVDIEVVPATTNRKPKREQIIAYLDSHPDGDVLKEAASMTWTRYLKIT